MAIFNELYSDDSPIAWLYDYEVVNPIMNCRAEAQA